jgi:chromosome segregation ATPase
MSALTVAEERATSALRKLELVLARRAPGTQPAAPDQERAALEHDCELLRAECDTLRRQLAAAEERSARLAAIVEQVEGRLDGAITQLDELTGEQGAAP